MTALSSETTTVTVVVLVRDVPDLPDAIVRSLVVVPERVVLRLTREVQPETVTERASVSVLGPRRLKSGEPGARDASSYGWEDAVPLRRNPERVRPEWLTRVIADWLPVGWSADLVDLSADDVTDGAS